MRKTKFSVKLVIYFILVVFGALCISTLFMHQKTKTTLEANMQLTSQQTMSQAVKEFQRYMKTLSLPIDIMCRRTEFKKIDENYTEDTIATIEDAMLSAIKVISQSERAYYYTVSGKYIQGKMNVSPDGKKTGEYLVKEDVDYADEHWVVNSHALKSRQTVFSYFSEPYVNDENVEVVTVSQELKASDVVIGVVGMDINADAFKEYINGIQLMNTGYTFLADADGNIIVNNAKNSIVASASEIPAWSELMASLNANLAQIEENGTTDTENALASTLCRIGAEEYCVTVIRDSITGWYLVGILGEEEIADDLNGVYLSAVSSLIIGLVVAVVVALVIAYSISKELKKLTEATEYMANGDMTQELIVKRTDEFGQLENNFNSMRQNIRKLILHVRENTEAILTISKSVSDVSDETKEITGQVTSAINSVAEGATDQANSMAEANREVDRLAESLVTSKDKVNLIADKSRNANELSRKGTQILDVLIAKTEKAKENAAASVVTMSEMMNSIEKINYISDAIADITAQTNLLSLNASIEAARAGESGKGFAVVADEIRKLAEQSNESTEEIKKILLEITDNSNQVEAGLKENGEIQDEQQKSVGESSQLFTEIKDAVDNLLEAVEEMEVLNQNMDTVKDSVVERMETIASVSETSAAASEQVTASAEQVNVTMARVAEHAKELDTIVKELDMSIQRFKL